ncbi:MAG: penicillin-binding protein 2 [Pseudomonadota bacterium]
MLDSKKEKIFNRRIFLLGALQTVALTALGARLAWLQIFEGSKYQVLADKNRINTKLIIPSRGEIFDRSGVPLAINNQNFRLLIIPEQAENLKEVLSNVSELIEIENWRINKVEEQAKKLASFLPIEIKDNLSWEEVSKLEVNISELPGIFIEEGEIRTYPFEKATSHIIGYLGAVNESEMTDDPLMKAPGFRIGKTGIEKAYDLNLRGASGTSHLEVNVRGRKVREIDRLKANQGQSLTLTIDSELQRFTQNRLSEHKSASAIIMDSKTGAVYAMASHPSFDPNLFSKGLSQNEWQEILNNPAFPLNNKSLSGQYPPASTFKMITTLAALEGGFFTSNETVYCTGSYQYGDDKFRCWKLSGHGYVNAISALAKSCDSYYYELSTEVGIDNIAKMAKKFGLGEKYNFDLTDEKAGLIPTIDWKKQALNEKWRPGETIVASIGQGYILSTPLQLAVMTSRLINGGYAVKPWLVEYVGQEKSQEKLWPKINVKNSSLNVIKKGMDRVVNDKTGTAFASKIEDENYSFGGKTGTAQVKRINRAERALGIMNDDLEWRFRHHALFVGYAPLNNPRYVCSVVVEHGGSGSEVAAPIARDLMLECQKRKPDQIEAQHV